MKLPLPSLPAVNVDDLHVYGGLVLLSIAGLLVAPALGVAILGMGLLLLGLLYSLAAAREAKKPKPATADFEAMKTASPVDEAA